MVLNKLLGSLCIMTHKLKTMTIHLFMRNILFYLNQKKKQTNLGNAFNKADPIIGSFDLCQTVIKIVPVIFLCPKKCAFLLLVKLQDIELLAFNDSVRFSLITVKLQEKFWHMTQAVMLPQA